MITMQKKTSLFKRFWMHKRYDFIWEKLFYDKLKWNVPEHRKKAIYCRHTFQSQTLDVFNQCHSIYGIWTPNRMNLKVCNFIHSVRFSINTNAEWWIPNYLMQIILLNQNFCLIYGFGENVLFWKFSNSSELMWTYGLQLDWISECRVMFTLRNNLLGGASVKILEFYTNTKRFSSDLIVIEPNPISALEKND